MGATHIRFGEGASAWESHPPQPRQKIAPTIAVDEVDHTDALSREKRSFTKTAYAFVCPPGLAPARWALAQNPPPRNAACWWDHPAARARKTRFFY